MFKDVKIFIGVFGWLIASEIGKIKAAETVDVAKPGSPAKTERPTNDSYVAAYLKVRGESLQRRHDEYAPSGQAYNTLVHSSYISDIKYPSLTLQQYPMTARPPSPPPVPVPSTRGAHNNRHHHHCRHTPTSSWHDLPYSSPSSEFSSLLPEKLSLKLLLKIILKLVLFKMVVKFIAVICLLLFIPTLRAQESGTDDDEGGDSRRMRHLNTVSEFIWRSVANSEKLSGYDLYEDNEISKRRQRQGNEQEQQGGGTSVEDQENEEDEHEDEESYYDQELKDMEEIAQQTTDPPPSGSEQAVRFLQICVSAIDRAIGLAMGYLRRNERTDFTRFLMDKFRRLVGQCLKLLELRVPAVVDIRDEAVLRCKFDLEEDELYSVKWYKEELEFFRYMPDNAPKVQTFPVDGVNVLELKSNATAITLSPLEYRSSGVYRCEVSSESPHFKTVYKSENMSVLGLPQGGPTIDGIKDTYFLGDYITGNCTSSPSNPAAQIQWFINDKKAEDWFLEYYDPSVKKEKHNLESRVLGLRFQVDLSHYPGKNQILSLTCQSSVAGRTKTQRVNVHLSRMMTNQKFAQEQINAKGGRIQSPFAVCVLIFVLQMSCC